MLEWLYRHLCIKCFYIKLLCVLLFNALEYEYIQRLASSAIAEKPPFSRKSALFSHNCGNKEKNGNIMEKNSFGRSNCCVFGIVGKLFQNVRGWCLFHANMLDISHVIQVLISPSPCPTTKLNFWTCGVHIFSWIIIILFKFKRCFTVFKSIRCKNNLFPLKRQVILLKFRQNLGIKWKKNMELGNKTEKAIFKTEFPNF